VGDATSQRYILENCAAQGSIISPLLFIIMINDLPDSLHDVESSLLADDSCIFKSDRNLKHIIKYIQDNLNRIAEWCNLWGFKISLDQTVAVFFSHRALIGIQLSLNNQPVKIDTKAKFLGLNFDCIRKLSWHDHINYIQQKCIKTVTVNACSCWKLGS